MISTNNLTLILTLSLKGGPSGSLTANSISTAEELAYHNDYMDLRNMLSSWEIGGVNFTGLDSAQLDSLNYYSSASSGRVKSKASALLKLNNALDYVEPVYLPSDVPDNKREEKPTNNIISQQSFLNLFPVPSADFITLDYQIKSSGNVYMAITDAQGKKVKEQALKYTRDEYILGIQDLNVGQYFIELISNSERIAKSFIKK